MKQLSQIMCPRTRAHQRSLCAATMALCVASFTAAPGHAQTLTPAPTETQTLPPLERHPDRLVNFSTANQLQAGGLQLHVGSHQTTPNYARSGTGNQIYHGGGDWGVTDRIQLSFAIQHFEDPVSRPINGLYPAVRFQAISLAAKYRIFEGERLSIAAEASVEQFVFESPLFGSRGGINGKHIVGSFHLPLSYKVSPSLQFHLTPGVSVFPDSVNGRAFYGTIASLGAGVTWKPGPRWLTYGSVTVPFGPGGNTISSTQAIVNRAIWTAGMRYNVSPKVAADLYVTNGIGTTPATRILSFFPSGNTPLIGARVIYTPGRGPGYRANYRGFSPTALTDRQISLQQDGFTLTSADTLTAGTLQSTFAYGDYGNQSGALTFSPDHDVQVELRYEQYAVDGSIGRTRTPNDAARYMYGTKLRLMDQNNGSPFSLSVRGLLGRDTLRSGVFYVDVAASYKAGPRVTYTANPKLAAFGSTTQFGLGLGVNYELARGLQVIAEITPVAHGYEAVWAAGLRYRIPKIPVSLDLHATNAIGRYGLGTLVAQNQTKIAFGTIIQLGLKRR